MISRLFGQVGTLFHNFAQPQNSCVSIKNGISEKIASPRS
ncbi:hypothetical protein PUN28_002032 [Cardiocondyla obscurior]|uniref:Uncharacterized protein n=1 Tax=Cardiocondyla obscurior TaxID=286306 RepID=A0AAW2GS71_9HYME